MEVTKESKGWHLHLHILLDARFIPIERLAIEWGHLLDQQFGIVKIIDCREKSYAHEVCKYVVSGSEIAKWSGEEILELVTAARGIRFFAPFGSLWKLGKKIKAELAASRPDATPCECGCSDFRYDTEESDAWADARRKSKK